mmetsp:Transcript_74898/g.206574  ORF Transcript_74898/g.206574 Transcript_74898/m.206574 type:complete len:200 (-) Transcript_74898:1038-1637(-)
MPGRGHVGEAVNGADDGFERVDEITRCLCVCAGRVRKDRRLPLGPQVDRADMGNDCTPMLLHALDRLVPHHRVDDSLDAEMLDHAARHHVRQLRGTAAYNRGLVASDKEAESSATALCQLRLHPLRRDVAAHRTDDAVDGRVPDHRLAALDPSAVRDVREGVDDVTQQRGILEHLLHQRHQRKRRARILPIARNEVRTR